MPAGNAQNSLSENHVTDIRKFTQKDVPDRQYNIYPMSFIVYSQMRSLIIHNCIYETVKKWESVCPVLLLMVNKLPIVLPYSSQ